LKRESVLAVEEELLILIRKIISIVNGVVVEMKSKKVHLFLFLINQNTLKSSEMMKI
jgi:hypothetical protein